MNWSFLKRTDHPKLVVLQTETICTNANVCCSVTLYHSHLQLWVQKILSNEWWGIKWKSQKFLKFQYAISVTLKSLVKRCPSETAVAKLVWRQADVSIQLKCSMPYLQTMKHGQWCQSCNPKTQWSYKSSFLVPFFVQIHSYYDLKSTWYIMFFSSHDV